MSCFLCGDPTPAEQGHHIVPRSRGGEAGPVVNLCANHHQLIHFAARTATRGKGYNYLFSDLDEVAQSRAEGLVQTILMADLQGEVNPKPLLTVELESPELLVALKRYQIDGGFTSQAATVNGILKAIANRYKYSEATTSNNRKHISNLFVKSRV